MCAMITMAVHDTEDNQRSKYTRETLESLFETAEGHPIYVVDNHSCNETFEYLASLQRQNKIHLIRNKENIGTARAVNLAWKYRKPTEHCIKIDNDVVINAYGWVEDLEEVVKLDPIIGQVGLKRKDLLESPFRTDQFRSSLRMLPHEKGQRWVIVEEVDGVMGTCVLHSGKLIDKIGGLIQPTNYGFDDTLMSIRTKLAGFKCCFLPHIEIDHIDTGGTDYTQWKQKHAGEQMRAFEQMKHDLINRKLPLKHEL